VVPGRQTLPWLSGTPPGDYWLEVGWLDAEGKGVDVLDANGNPQRRVVTLGPIHVTEAIGGVTAADAPALLRVGSPELLESHFEPPEAEAGSKVVFDALWRVGGQRSAVSGQQASVLLTAWQDAAGVRFPLVPPVSIPADYPPGTVFRSRNKLGTPFEAPPGSLALLAEGDDLTPVGQLTLLPTDRNFAPPSEPDIQADANFGNKATLLGANVDNLSLSPGQSTRLTLYWRAEASFAEDYTVFVHLLGADGTPLVIADHAPPRATSTWLEGEIIADPVTLTLPADTPPGAYPLEVGFYNTNNPNYPRLPLADASADYFILTKIAVSNQ
jgi:hypothetical protein